MDNREQLRRITELTGQIAGLLLLCLFRCGSSLYGAAPGKSIAILCKPSRLCFLYLCH